MYRLNMGFVLTRTLPSRSVNANEVYSSKFASEVQIAQSVDYFLKENLLRAHDLLIGKSYWYYMLWFFSCISYNVVTSALYIGTECRLAAL